MYAIAGPTASGKTALGVELALRVGGEVINFDSVQIYKGIEIATAKPTAEEMRGVPHHLIDYVDPNVNYTAGDWARDAAEKIVEIGSRGKVPMPGIAAPISFGLDGSAFFTVASAGCSERSTMLTSRG